jgi:hypothetical protein
MKIFLVFIILLLLSINCQTTKRNISIPKKQELPKLNLPGLEDNKDTQPKETKETKHVKNKETNNSSYTGCTLH